MPGELPTTTVVVPSHNEGANLARTVAGLLSTLPPWGDVVVVDDASTDGSAEALACLDRVRVIRPPERLGVARARNLGGATATGDVVVFCDAHVQLHDGWLAPLVDVLTLPKVGVVGPAVHDTVDVDTRGYGQRIDDTTLTPEWLPWNAPYPYGVPALCGAFMALRRSTFAGVGGFDPGLRQWGSEDVELCIRLALLGWDLVVVPEVAVGHQFRSSFPYAVDDEAVLANVLRTAIVHLDGDRLSRFLDDHRDNRHFEAALADVLAGGVLPRRDWLRAVRLHDYGWYAARFAVLEAA